MEETLTIKDLTNRLKKDFTPEKYKYAPIYINTKHFSYKEFELWLNQQPDDKEINIFYTRKYNYLFIETNIIKNKIDPEKLLRLF